MNEMGQTTQDLHSKIVSIKTGLLTLDLFRKVLAEL